MATHNLVFESSTIRQFLNPVDNNDRKKLLINNNHLVKL